MVHDRLTRVRRSQARPLWLTASALFVVATIHPDGENSPNWGPSPAD